MFQQTGTAPNFYGSTFFLRTPSVDNMSNASILILPTLFHVYHPPIHYFLRIYTNLDFIGQISIDGLTITALLYQRIGQTNYYYYEQLITNNTHLINTTQASARFAVNILTVIE